MAKTLKDLALALLNATLLLIALCLFLAWQVASKVDGMIATFASNLEIVAPLREDVQAMTGEVAALRTDLASLSSQGAEAGSATMRAVQNRVAALETQLSQAGARIDALLQAPGALVDQAIDRTMTSAASEFSRAINDIRGCGKAL
ncbi:MAG: hypothetical protein ACK5MY_14745 [Jhaorihella sp.]